MLGRKDDKTPATPPVATNRHSSTPVIGQRRVYRSEDERAGQQGGAS